MEDRTISKGGVQGLNSGYMIRIKEVKFLFRLPDVEIPSTGVEAIDLTNFNYIPEETCHLI